MYIYIYLYISIYTYIYLNIHFLNFQDSFSYPSMTVILAASCVLLTRLRARSLAFCRRRSILCVCKNSNMTHRCSATHPPTPTHPPTTHKSRLTYTHPERGWSSAHTPAPPTSPTLPVHPPTHQPTHPTRHTYTYLKRGWSVASALNSPI